MTIFVNAKTARRAAFLGAEKLASLVQPDGHFRYQYVERGGIRLPPGYNALRHFGSCWAMLDVGKEPEAPSGLVDAATKAIQFGLTAFVRPFGANDVLSVVDTDNKIKVGGCGIALTALGAMDGPARNADVVALAEAMGRYILSQRLPDGDFIHCRFAATGENTQFVSKYYTGEALLGLFSLSSITGEAAWAEAALDSLAQLAQRDYGVAERSHWMLYSLERAIDFRDDPRWHDLGRKIVRTIISIPSSEWQIAASWLACNCEGLVTWFRTKEAHGFADADREVRHDCLRTLRRMLRKLIALQSVDGAFVRDGKAPIVRIDYIQHAISALIGFSRLRSVGV